MPATAQTAVAVIGIDIGKNSFHIVGLDSRGVKLSWHVGFTPVRSTVSATPLAVYRPAFGSPRSFADVD